MPLLVDVLLDRVSKQIGVQAAGTSATKPCRSCCRIRLSRQRARAREHPRARRDAVRERPDRARRYPAASRAAAGVSCRRPWTTTMRSRTGSKGQLEHIEREAIVRALEQTRYNKTKAAELLGMCFRQLGIGSRSWGSSGTAACRPLNSIGTLNDQADSPPGLLLTVALLVIYSFYAFSIGSIRILVPLIAGGVVSVVASYGTAMTWPWSQYLVYLFHRRFRRQAWTFGVCGLDRRLLRLPVRDDKRNRSVVRTESRDDRAVRRVLLASSTDTSGCDATARNRTTVSNSERA